MTERATREALLARARSLYRAGEVLAALDACRLLADLSRAAGDSVLLAEAALLVRRPTDPVVRARVHALAAEARAGLGPDEHVLRTRVEAQVTATDDPLRPRGASGWELPDDPQTAFLALQAELATLPVPRVAERLVLADRAVELGRLAGEGEFERWGRRWRMDALAVLGRRAELVDELTAAVPRMEHAGPEWASYLSLARASQLIWEGRFAEASRAADQARDLGGPGSDAAYLHLVFAHSVAARTGVGLVDVAAQVRQVVDGMPHQARGWLCSALVSLGRLREAGQVWAAVAPHLGGLPDAAPELLVALSGAAEVCVALEDRATAGPLYERLLPLEHLHVIAHAHGPYEGPVALALGRLALLLGHRAAALGHLEHARATCETIAALPSLAQVHAELAAAHGPLSGSGRAHARASRRLATQLGMRPLGDRLDRWVTTTGPGQALTSREREVADLVAGGLSNASVAERLTLSERTVENHVSRVLHKLGVGSRTALAVWVTETRAWEDGRG